MTYTKPTDLLALLDRSTEAVLRHTAGTWLADPERTGPEPATFATLYTRLLDVAALELPEVLDSENTHEIAARAIARLAGLNTVSRHKGQLPAKAAPRPVVSAWLAEVMPADIAATLREAARVNAPVAR